MVAHVADNKFIPHRSVYCDGKGDNPGVQDNTSEVMRDPISFGKIIILKFIVTPSAGGEMKLL